VAQGERAAGIDERGEAHGPALEFGPSAGKSFLFLFFYIAISSFQFRIQIQICVRLLNQTTVKRSDMMQSIIYFDIIIALFIFGKYLFNMLSMKEFSPLKYFEIPLFSL
jgi:hypothetical protein